VHFTLKKVGSVAGTMTLVLDADETQPTSGVQLTITTTTGSRKLALKFAAGGKQLAAAEVEAAQEDCALAVERRGEFLVVFADDAPVLQTTWPVP
jgi:hypothetical protein